MYKDVKIINLTKHPFCLWKRPEQGEVFEDERGTIVFTVPPSGQVARVSASKTYLDPLRIDGHFVRVSKPTFGEVEGLPAPQEGIVYFVSGMIRAACPKRIDLFSPLEPVTDSYGNVIGCYELASNTF